MRNVLEYSRDLLRSALLSQQQVLYPLERIINEMIPGAGVAIKHRRSLDVLPTIWLAALTLKGIVSVTVCTRSVLEQFP